MNTINKYLDRYAEPESNLIRSPVQPIQYVLVIPAFKESLSQLEQVWSKLTNLIVILVVNSADASEPVTGKLLDDIEANWRQIQSSQNCTWYQSQQQVILVVDRYTNPIPPRQGVGKARKIGADIALRLINNGDVLTPWIMSTDADAILPGDYFNAATDELAFLLYPFLHDLPDEAAALYEFSLLWYAYGLKFAGSNYAYPTVGSTIACQANAYAQVRGFPQRSAGEDFYLLNKLRKIGPFALADSHPIQLSSRESDRVPFGTGTGIKSIRSLPAPIRDYLFYHPQCFVSLGRFLNALQTCQPRRNLKAHFKDPIHWQFMEQQGLDKLILSKQEQTAGVFDKFLTDWFDGFKTLKFVHFIREHQHGSVAFENLWQSELLPKHLPRSSADTGIQPIDIQTATTSLWNNL